MFPGLLSILGAVAGGQKDEVKNTSSSGVRLGSATSLENLATEGMSLDYNKLRSLIDAGPGQSDVTDATGASRDLASMLAAYSKEGGANPTAGDISGANSLAASLFNPQRVAMQQAFGDQTTDANRQAALMGRSLNDPILRAKLAQEQTRQSSMLEANQGAFASQYAMQQPMQRLGFMGQRADVLGGLASQAMANRQALLSLGSNIQGNERNWRLNAGERYGSNTQTSGGGLKGAITGGMAGFSTEMGIAAQMAGMAMGAGGGGGGAGMMAGMGGGGGGGAPSMGSFFGGGNPYAGSAAPAFSAPATMPQNFSMMTQQPISSPFGPNSFSFK